MVYGIAWAVLLTLTAVPPEAGQAGQHFYNVDREIRVEGVVREISLEPRYKDTAPFLVLRVEDTKGGRLYLVEVSPSWFFGQDLHKGEKVEVVGSLSGQTGEVQIVIAREIRFRGESFTLRDKRGFPSWRGGPRRGRGIRRVGGS